MEIYLFENIIEKIRAITVLARESLLPTKYYKKHYTFYVYISLYRVHPVQFCTNFLQMHTNPNYVYMYIYKSQMYFHFLCFEISYKRKKI